MCLLITSDQEFPFNRLLQLAELQNNDGGGIAWLEKGKIRWFKGLTAKEIGKLRHSTTGPYLIHFRIATVGGPLPELTHPFPVGTDTGLELEGEADAVIAHNGHWWDWSYELYYSYNWQDNQYPAGPWSDTRAMAWLVGKYGETFIPNYINKDQRIAILDKDGIRRYGNGWMKHGPLYLSNDPFGRGYYHSTQHRYPQCVT